jgi:flagellin-specific chaperone FliS
LLNKQPNKSINRYTDTAQLIDKKKMQKEGTNVTKLITNILTELKTTAI